MEERCFRPSPEIESGPLPQVLPGDFPCATGCGQVILWIDGRRVWGGDDEFTTVDWLRGVYSREINQARNQVRLEVWGPFYRAVYSFDHRRKQFKIAEFRYLP